MRRANFRIGKSDADSSITVHGRILNGFKLWTPELPNAARCGPPKCNSQPEYFESLLEHAVPLNESAVARLSHNAMALDTYAWLAQRLHRIEKGKTTVVSWVSLAEQFGAGYAQVREFRRVFKRTLAQVKVVYPDATLRPHRCRHALGAQPPAGGASIASHHLSTGNGPS